MDDSAQRGYAALRRGRTSLPRHAYPVTTVTRDREPVFQDLRLGRIVVNSLVRVSPQALTLCYVVMPDHLHWLMVLRPGATLAGAVRSVKGYSSYRIGGLTGTGHGVWQQGFHERALRRQDDLAHVARYVVANPVRAGLVASVARYPLWDAVWL